MASPADGPGNEVEGRMKTGDSFRSLTADRLIGVFDFDVRNLFLL